MKQLGCMMRTIWRDQRGIERLEVALVVALLVLTCAAAIRFLAGPGK